MAENLVWPATLLALMDAVIRPLRPLYIPFVENLSYPLPADTPFLTYVLKGAVQTIWVSPPINAPSGS